MNNTILILLLAVCLNLRANSELFQCNGYDAFDAQDNLFSKGMKVLLKKSLQTEEPVFTYNLATSTVVLNKNDEVVFTTFQVIDLEKKEFTFKELLQKDNLINKHYQKIQDNYFNHNFGAYYFSYNSRGKIKPLRANDVNKVVVYQAKIKADFYNRTIAGNFYKFLDKDQNSLFHVYLEDSYLHLCRKPRIHQSFNRERHNNIRLGHQGEDYK
ncbi:hypothetical protein N9N67_11260 [Bacteriovoracaceae bacterium]|nr:hypothetical protein [Bacteriovoracaceae bacterium]